VAVGPAAGESEDDVSDGLAKAKMIQQAAAYVAGIEARVAARERTCRKGVAGCELEHAHEHVKLADELVNETQAWQLEPGRIERRHDAHVQVEPPLVAAREAREAVAAERAAERAHDETMARMEHESRLLQLRFGPLELVMPANLVLAGGALLWLLAAGALVLR
jgi:hypothetical protein